MLLAVQALPEPVRLLLLQYLTADDLDALHAASVADWRPRSPWQERLPVELVQHILGYLAPPSFYTAANRVCARWRTAGRSVLLLRAMVRRARELSSTARQDLRHVTLGRETDVDRLWTYFLVAAPLRSSAPRERPHRVCTLDFRACAPRDPSDASCVLPPRVFASDYAGVLVFAAASGLRLYSVDRLRVVRAGRSADPKSYMATLSYPPLFSHGLLLDISIAHQTSDSRHLVLFAVFQDPKQRRKGLLFRSDIYYVSKQDTHTFAQVQHTPLVPIWDRSWGKDSMPAMPEWLSCLSGKRSPPSRDVRIQVIEPPHPCATAVAVRTPKSVYILLFDVLVDKASGRALSPYQRYKASRPHPQPIPDEGSVRRCPVNPTRLLFAMSPGKHRRRRHNVSTDRSYPPMNEDRDAIVDRESFLEWFSGLCWPPYTSVLKSYQGRFHYGIEFCDGRLLMTSNKLTHNGLIFNKTLVELALPPAMSTRPACIAALDISDDDSPGRGVILVAAYWDDPCEVHLYEVPGGLSSREHVLVQPRRLAKFNVRTGQPRRAACMVDTMRFYGGVSRTWRGIPCESAALLVVIMTAGFVHVCQLGTGSPASYYRPDWSLNAASKLKLGVKSISNQGWRRYWTVQQDGTLAP